MAAEIVAGRVNQINGDCGEWLIVDIGFRMEEASCGIWHGPETLDVVTFSKLKQLAIEKVEENDPPFLNLLLEAPLSVAIQTGDELGRRLGGDPARRVCDTYRGKHRDWWYNAGAATLLAAGFLLRELVGRQNREVRLFEGFASFKSDEVKRQRRADPLGPHRLDVRDLLRAVTVGDNARIFSPEELQEPEGQRVESPFPFFDRGLVPPVIRINPDL